MTHSIIEPNPKRGAALLVAGLTTYAILISTLSISGAFDILNPNLFPSLIPLGIITVTLCYFFIPSIRALAIQLGPYGLAGFHMWRVIPGAIFVYFGTQGWLPPAFAFGAGWGDISAGIFAALLFFLPRSFWIILLFHIYGLADLLYAVSSGAYLNLTTPGAMDNITKFPLALVPLVGVPLSASAHIAALHLLLVKRAPLTRP